MFELSNDAWIFGKCGLLALVKEGMMDRCGYGMVWSGLAWPGLVLCRAHIQLTTYY